MFSTTRNPLQPNQPDSESSRVSSSQAAAVSKDSIFVQDQDLDPEKEANELRIELCRGRNLAAVDREFYGATSDPRVRFVIQGTEMKKEPSGKSTAKKDTLNPVWNEVVKIKFKASKQGSKTPILTAYVEDWDMVGEADALGQFVIPISNDRFGSHKIVSKKWYKLQASSKQTVKVSGEIECAFQWWYNPEVDVFHPFKSELKKIHDPTVIPRPPNELRVGVFRAKGIVGDDESMLGGGEKVSDPRVKLTVLRPKPAAVMTLPQAHLHPKVAEDEKNNNGGTEEEKADDDEAEQDEAVPFDIPHYTQKCSKTLRPVWKELVIIEQVKPPVDKAKSAADFPSLELVVEDVDLTGQPAFLGKVVIDLAPLANQRVSKLKWYKLEDDTELNTKKYKITGSIELTLLHTYNKSIDPHGDEPHKNETILSYLTPDFLEDAIEKVVKTGQEIFYDIYNTMVLIADLYEISQVPSQMCFYLL